MMPTIPTYVSVAFILTTLFTLIFLYAVLVRSSVQNRVFRIFGGIALWMILQAALSFQGFYSDHLDVMPPRIPIIIAPPLIVILLIFLTRSGRAFLDSLSLSTLTYLHVVRIPVELILFALFVYAAIPQLMTFEGRNWDILAGITAPLVAFWGIQRGNMGRTALLVWNFLCLGLLFNIVFHAILSIPLPFQRFAFDQPNLAVLYFPYIWLPGVIVPIVLFSHLASIRQLMARKSAH